MKQATIKWWNVIIENTIRKGNECRERLMKPGNFEASFKWESDTIFKAEVKVRLMKDMLEELEPIESKGQLIIELNARLKFLEERIFQFEFNQSTNPLTFIGEAWTHDVYKDLYKFLKDVISEEKEI